MHRDPDVLRDGRHLGDAGRGVRLVAAAHVRDVHGARLRERLGEDGELLGRGEDSRHVVESGREAEGAGVEPVGHERAHRGRARAGDAASVDRPQTSCRTVPAGTSMPDVQRGRAVVAREQRLDAAAAIGRVRAIDRREVLARVAAVARCVRDAVLSADDGRHALAQQRELHVGIEDEPVDVGVRVDESGHDEPASALDHVRGRRRRPIVPPRLDADDVLALDDDVDVRGAGAVGVGVDGDHVADEDASFGARASEERAHEVDDARAAGVLDDGEPAPLVEGGARMREPERHDVADRDGQAGHPTAGTRAGR